MFNLRTKLLTHTSNLDAASMCYVNRVGSTELYRSSTRTRRAEPTLACRMLGIQRSARLHSPYRTPSHTVVGEDPLDAHVGGFEERLTVLTFPKAWPTSLSTAKRRRCRSSCMPTLVSDMELAFDQIVAQQSEHGPNQFVNSLLHGSC